MSLQIGSAVEDALEKDLKPAMMTNVRERFTKDPPSGSGTARKQRPRNPAAARRVPSSNGSADVERPMRGVLQLSGPASSCLLPLRQCSYILAEADAILCVATVSDGAEQPNDAMAICHPVHAFDSLAESAHRLHVSRPPKCPARVL